MKARGFVLNRDTGEPVSGVNVVARAKRNGTTTSLGLLTTDQAGYVSFDLSAVVDPTALEGVSLEVVGQPDSAATVVGEDLEGERPASVPSTDGAVVLRVDPARVETVATSTRPAVQEPDARDWELSPASFVTPRTVALGEGKCTTPVRSTLPVHQIRFVQIVRRPTQPAPPPTYPQSAPGGDGSQVMVELPPGRVDVSNPLLDPISPARDVMLGMLPCDILEYEQTWKDIGESLGTILYSLPLAPCESVKIAVIEAERSDEAARSDAIDARENLTHSLFRDRHIAETVKGVLRESQGGSSFMAGQGAAYSGSWQNVGTFGVTHAIGYATSQSQGRRNVDANSAQDLHDSTVQNTDYVRSLNSTVIVQGAQAERHQLETRTITNHNHCHALTVQYYEVLRRLKLETRYVGSRPGVLIPYQGLRFKSPSPAVVELDDQMGHKYKAVLDPDRDDLHLVNRLRPMLENNLLESRLQPNFDAVRRLLFFDDPEAAAPAPEIPSDSSDYWIDRIDATVLRGPLGTDSNAVKLRVVLNEQREALFKEDGKLTPKVTLENSHFRDDHPEYEDAPEPLGPIKLTLADPVRRSKIKGFEIHWAPTGVDLSPDFSLRGLKVTARTPDGQEDVLVDEPSGRNFEKPGVEPFGVTVPKPPEPPDPKTTGADKAQQAAAQRAQDLGLAWELITHLYDQRDTYSPQLVAMKEPMWFAEALDWAMGRGAARDSVDSVPVAISGQHIVFGYHGGDSSITPAQPTIEQPDPTYVSLPTRGVLAEAQLGNCNACEKRDVTRFWKWEESPCEQAPAIEGITPGFRGQPTKVEQGQLPNAVVQITQPPAAPDPVGLAAALNLLSKGDAFRDMSGLQPLSQLLTGLANGAIDLVKARQLANQVASGAGSQPGAATTGAQAPATEPDAARQIDRLDAINYAAEKGLINDGQKQNAAVGVLGGESVNSLEDKSSALKVSLRGNTPSARAFGPEVRNLTGTTRVTAVVSGVPSGSSYRWSVSRAGSVRIVDPGLLSSDVVAGESGLTDLSFEVLDPTGAALKAATTRLSVPQFVQIVEDAAAFNAQLKAYQLDDVKVTVLRRCKLVVDLLLQKANVRVVWALPPFNDKLPTDLQLGGPSSGKYNVLTIHGAPPAAGLAGRTATAGGVGPGNPSELIDVWPGAYVTFGNDVGPDTAALVAKMASLKMTEPNLKSLWIDVVSRLLGETIAHEIHHALLGLAGFDASGHNSPSIPWDLMNTGLQRPFVQRTGIEVVDITKFPDPASYRDGGLGAISSVMPANQARVDAILPVPPTFK